MSELGFAMRSHTSQVWFAWPLRLRYALLMMTSYVRLRRDEQSEQRLELWSAPPYHFVSLRQSISRSATTTQPTLFCRLFLSTSARLRQAKPLFATRTGSANDVGSAMPYVGFVASRLLHDVVSRLERRHGEASVARSRSEQ